MSMKQDMLYQMAKTPTILEPNVLEVKGGMLIPVRCLSLPAPRVVIELTKYECKSDCRGARYSYLKRSAFENPVQMQQWGI